MSRGAAEPKRDAGGVYAVTGAAGGIGSAVVEHLIAAGHRVVMLDQASDLATTAAKLDPDGASVAHVVSDLSTETGVRPAIERAWDAWDGLDGLANVAGIFPSQPALELSETDWERVLGANLSGPFLCARAYARSAIGADRPGSVVNVSSTAARLARPGIAAYGAAKAGLEQLTRVLAVEWAPYGIRVNAVAPGVIATQPVRDSEATPDGRAEAATKRGRIPLGRFGAPEEAAELVTALLTGHRYCTGSIVTVDGGFSLGMPATGSPRP